MDQQLFADLQQTLKTKGPEAAIEYLCSSLRQRQDYPGLFYALLLKKRHELGAPPMPSSSGPDLPAAMHQPYEEAIRAAGRLVGQLFLDEGNIPQGWSFFRMLGEPGPVAEALEKFTPAEDEDLQQLIDIAYTQGVHPRRGFDLILQRYGICSAITTLGTQEFPHGREVRDYCFRRLVQALYNELRDRLKTEIARTQGFEPTGQSVRELLQGRDWLFGEDVYLIDMSHLASIVQMSIHLEPCPELELARQLCEYGQGLAPRFGIRSDPPFEDFYRDYSIFLAVIAGEQLEEGLAHFRAKVEAVNPEEGTFAAEVLVNLLLRINQPREALAVARQYLVGAGDGLACPSVVELCQRNQDYAALAEVSRAQGNAVNFLAALITAGKSPETGAVA